MNHEMRMVAYAEQDRVNGYEQSKSQLVAYCVCGDWVRKKSPYLLYEFPEEYSHHLSEVNWSTPITQSSEVDHA